MRQIQCALVVLVPVLVVLLQLCFANAYAQLADTMLCADESCTKTISQGEARLAYRPKDPKFLPLKKGEVILVKSKNAGKKSHLWGGEEFLKKRQSPPPDDTYANMVAPNQKITIDKSKKSESSKKPEVKDFQDDKGVQSSVKEMGKDEKTRTESQDTKHPESSLDHNVNDPVTGGGKPGEEEKKREEKDSSLAHSASPTSAGGEKEDVQDESNPSGKDQLSKDDAEVIHPSQASNKKHPSGSDSQVEESEKEIKAKTEDKKHEEKDESYQSEEDESLKDGIKIKDKKQEEKSSPEVPAKPSDKLSSEISNKEDAKDLGDQGAEEASRKAEDEESLSTAKEEPEVRDAKQEENSPEVPSDEASTHTSNNEDGKDSDDKDSQAEENMKETKKDKEEVAGKMPADIAALLGDSMSVDKLVDPEAPPQISKEEKIHETAEKHDKEEGKSGSPKDSEAYTQEEDAAHEPESSKKTESEIQQNEDIELERKDVNEPAEETEEDQDVEGNADQHSSKDIEDNSKDPMEEETKDGQNPAGSNIHQNSATNEFEHVVNKDKIDEEERGNREPLGTLTNSETNLVSGKSQDDIGETGNEQQEVEFVGEVFDNTAESEKEKDVRGVKKEESEDKSAEESVEFLEDVFDNTGKNTEERRKENIDEHVHDEKEGSDVNEGNHVENSFPDEQNVGADGEGLNKSGHKENISQDDDQKSREDNDAKEAFQHKSGAIDKDTNEKTPVKEEDIEVGGDLELDGNKTRDANQNQDALETDTENKVGKSDDLDNKMNDSLTKEAVDSMAEDDETSKSDDELVQDPLQDALVTNKEDPIIDKKEVELEKDAVEEGKSQDDEEVPERNKQKDAVTVDSQSTVSSSNDTVLKETSDAKEDELSKSQKVHASTGQEEDISSKTGIDDPQEVHGKKEESDEDVQKQALERNKDNSGKFITDEKDKDGMPEQPSTKSEIPKEADEAKQESSSSEHPLQEDKEAKMDEDSAENKQGSHPEDGVHGSIGMTNFGDDVLLKWFSVPFNKKSYPTTPSQKSALETIVKSETAHADHDLTKSSNDLKTNQKIDKGFETDMDLPESSSYELTNLNQDPMLKWFSPKPLSFSPPKIVQSNIVSEIKTDEKSIEEKEESLLHVKISKVSSISDEENHSEDLVNDPDIQISEAVINGQCLNLKSDPFLKRTMLPSIYARDNADEKSDEEEESLLHTKVSKESLASDEENQSGELMNEPEIRIDEYTVFGEVVINDQSLNLRSNPLLKRTILPTAYARDIVNELKTDEKLDKEEERLLHMEVSKEPVSDEENQSGELMSEPEIKIDEYTVFAEAVINGQCLNLRSDPFLKRTMLPSIHARDDVIELKTDEKSNEESLLHTDVSKESSLSEKDNQSEEVTNDPEIQIGDYTVLGEAILNDQCLNLRSDPFLKRTMLPNAYTKDIVNDIKRDEVSNEEEEGLLYIEGSKEPSLSDKENKSGHLTNDPEIQISDCTDFSEAIINGQCLNLRLDPFLKRTMLPSAYARAIESIPITDSEKDPDLVVSKELDDSDVKLHMITELDSLLTPSILEELNQGDINKIMYLRDDPLLKWFQPKTSPASSKTTHKIKKLYENDDGCTSYLRDPILKWIVLKTAKCVAEAKKGENSGDASGDFQDSNESEGCTSLVNHPMLKWIILRTAKCYQKRVDSEKFSSPIDAQSEADLGEAEINKENTMLEDEANAQFTNYFNHPLLKWLNSKCLGKGRKEDREQGKSTEIMTDTDDHFCSYLKDPVLKHFNSKDDKCYLVKKDFKEYEEEDAAVEETSVEITSGSGSPDPRSNVWIALRNLINSFRESYDDATGFRVFITDIIQDLKILRKLKPEITSTFSARARKHKQEAISLENTLLTHVQALTDRFYNTDISRSDLNHIEHEFIPRYQAIYDEVQILLKGLKQNMNALHQEVSSETYQKSEDASEENDEIEDKRIEIAKEEILKLQEKLDKLDEKVVQKDTESSSIVQKMTKEAEAFKTRIAELEKVIQKKTEDEAKREMSAEEKEKRFAEKLTELESALHQKENDEKIKAAQKEAFEVKKRLQEMESSIKMTVEADKPFVERIKLLEEELLLRKKQENDRIKQERSEASRLQMKIQNLERSLKKRQHQENSKMLEEAKELQAKIKSLEHNLSEKTLKEKEVESTTKERSMELKNRIETLEEDLQKQLKSQEAADKGKESEDLKARVLAMEERLKNQEEFSADAKGKHNKIKQKIIKEDSHNKTLHKSHKMSPQEILTFLNTFFFQSNKGVQASPEIRYTNQTDKVASQLLSTKDEPFHSELDFRCNVEPAKRKACGSSYHSKEFCNALRCCWSPDPVNPSSPPCYFSLLQMANPETEEGKEGKANQKKTEENPFESYDALHEGKVVNWDESLESEQEKKKSLEWDEEIGRDDDEIHSDVMEQKPATDHVSEEKDETYEETESPPAHEKEEKNAEEKKELSLAEDATPPAATPEQANTTIIPPEQPAPEQGEENATPSSATIPEQADTTIIPPQSEQIPSPTQEVTQEPSNLFQEASKAENVHDTRESTQSVHVQVTEAPVHVTEEEANDGENETQADTGMTENGHSDQQSGEDSDGVTDEEYTKSDDISGGQKDGDDELHVESLVMRLLFILSSFPFDVIYVLEPFFLLWLSLLPEEYRNDVHGVSWTIILSTFFIGFFLIWLMVCRSRASSRRRKNEKAQKTIEELRSQLETIMQEKLEKENELQGKQIELDMQRDEVTNATQEKVNVVTEKTKLEDSLREYSMQNEALQQELRKLNHSLQEKDQTIQKAKANSQQVEKSLGAQQEAITQYESSIVQLQNLVRENEEEKKKMEESISKFQERMKSLEKAKGDTKKESKTLKDQVSKLNEKVSELEGVLSTERDEAEQKRQEIDVLKDCILQFKGAQDYLTEDGEDAESEETIEKQKERMKSLVEVANVRSVLRQAEAEKLQVTYELEAERKSRIETEGKISELEATIQGDLAFKNKLERDKQMLESKLTVMQEFYAKREVEIQSKLGMEQSKRESNASLLEEHQQQQLELIQQLDAYKKMSEEAKRQYEDSERQHKQEILAFEKKSHESWLATRDAERKFDEAQKQINHLHLELSDMQRRLRESQDREPIIRPRPERHGPPGAPPPFGPPRRPPGVPASPLHFRKGPPSDVDRRSPPPMSRRPPSPGNSLNEEPRSHSPKGRPQSRPDRPPSAHSLPPIDRRPPSGPPMGPGQPYPGPPPSQGPRGRGFSPYRGGMPPQRPPPSRDFPPHRAPASGPRTGGPMTSPYMDRPPMMSSQSPGPRSQNFTQASLHAPPMHAPMGDSLHNEGLQPPPPGTVNPSEPPRMGIPQGHDGVNPFRRPH